MNLSKHAAGLALGLGMTLASAGASQAAVLTFDGSICSGGGACSSYSPIDQSYGDIAGVDVQYNRNVKNAAYTTGAAGSEVLWWNANYNDLFNVAFGDQGGTPMIFLKAVGGSVTLHGFDLGAYYYATNRSQFTIVDGLGAILFSSGPISVGVGATTHNHYDFNFSSNTGIGIQWGPDGYNTGIDNVSFSAGPLIIGGGVPEPATWALLIMGFGLAGSALRSRRLAPVRA